MKNLHRLAITLLALTMGIGSLASAQQRDHSRSDRNERQIERGGPHDRSDRNQGSRRADKRHQRSGPQYHADNDRQRDNQGYNQRGEWRDRNGEWRGAGPGHNFRRGGYLTPQYRSRHYVVEDWRGHHLNAPPRGYHWVQTGGDYVLVAIATGLILEILLNY